MEDSPMRLLIVAAFSLVALPAHALDPVPGDLFVVDQASAYHIDADTGDRTVISCWGVSTSHCPGGVELGTGPGAFPTEDITVSPDGRLISCCQAIVRLSSGFGIVAIDPKTGDREMVSSTTFGPGDGPNVQGPIAAWPRFNFFTIEVSALPPWGIAVAIGFLAGISWRRLRAQ